MSKQRNEIFKEANETARVGEKEEKEGKKKRFLPIEILCGIEFLDNSLETSSLKKEKERRKSKLKPFVLLQNHLFSQPKEKPLKTLSSLAYKLKPHRQEIRNLQFRTFSLTALCEISLSWSAFVSPLKMSAQTRPSNLPPVFFFSTRAC